MYIYKSIWGQLRWTVEPPHACGLNLTKFKPVHNVQKTLTSGGVDFDSAIQGSNPSTPAFKQEWCLECSQRVVFNLHKLHN
jgi:hypothetical protein